MSVAVQHVSPDSRPVVERLLQLYEYDVSGLFGADVGEDGLYHVMDLDEIWQHPYRVFTIRMHDHLAGLALITRHPAYLGAGETWLMNEFFVMCKYRRQGVGERAARALFDRFPGRWEVAGLAENTVAQAFWREVIRRYTGGRFGGMTIDNERWRGPVQAFASNTRVTPPTG